MTSQHCASSASATDQVRIHCHRGEAVDVLLIFKYSSSLDAVRTCHVGCYSVTNTSIDAALCYVQHADSSWLPAARSLTPPHLSCPE
jgi:hypothetical protein